MGSSCVYPAMRRGMDGCFRCATHRLCVRHRLSLGMGSFRVCADRRCRRGMARSYLPGQCSRVVGAHAFRMCPALCSCGMLRPALRSRLRFVPSPSVVFCPRSVAFDRCITPSFLRDDQKLRVPCAFLFDRAFTWDVRTKKASFVWSESLQLACMI